MQTSHNQPPVRKRAADWKRPSMLTEILLSLSVLWFVVVLNFLRRTPTNGKFRMRPVCSWLHWTLLNFVISSICSGHFDFINQVEVKEPRFLKPSVGFHLFSRSSAQWCSVNSCFARKFQVADPADSRFWHGRLLQNTDFFQSTHVEHSQQVVPPSCTKWSCQVSRFLLPTSIFPTKSFKTTDKSTLWGSSRRASASEPRGWDVG